MSKPVVTTIDNVRIIRFNEYNLAVERYEQVFIPRTKTYELKWVFKGYASTILKCLELISREELLIDEMLINDINDYIKQVKKSNNKIKNLKEND